MAKNYTKAQAKRALIAINKKRNKLFDDGYLTIADIVAIGKVVDRAMNRLK